MPDQDQARLDQDQDRLEFAIPPRVSVREEYLIYDSVALISAIGGTLGIFIGFSFGGMSGQILKFISEIVASQERRVNAAGESRDPESTREIT